MDIKHEYRIVGRYMKGVEVLGYHLVDRVGRDGFAKKEAVYELALDNNISNCKAQLYNGVIVLKGVGCKLSELPVMDVDTKRIRGRGVENTRVRLYRISGRIFKGKQVIGYRITDINRNESDIRKSDAILLAKSGSIENARVQMNNGKEILRGVNCDLAQLPLIQLERSV